MINIYGLANCDTTKATIKLFKTESVSFDFHDYKVDGITGEKLQEWLTQIPLEKLLNKKSTTWRGLSPEEQATANTETGAILLMQENTSLIKRPLVEWNDGTYSAGFDEKAVLGKIKS